MKINKFVVALVMATAMPLATVESVHASVTPSGTYVADAHRWSYNQAKKHYSRVYKLAYFENRMTGDQDDAYYTLGYYRKGKIINKRLSTDNNDFTEIIDPNLKTPYVGYSKKHDAWYIHRPPYNMYNQPAVSGKVTAKEAD